jgi:FlgD Ig-like domain
MTKTANNILLLALATLMTSISMKAGSRLSFVRSSDSAVQVRLSNDVAVAGIQFVIHSSSNIRLETMQAGNRTIGSGWSVSSNVTDDSTMYVLMIRTGRENLAPGDGPIALLRIAVDENSASDFVISMDNLVAASPAASSLDITTEPLQWGNSVSFVLHQNFPNPFNPTTTIPYTLQQTAHVKITVYDITGREIKDIEDGVFAGGDHSVTWNSTDNAGVLVPSGIYFVRLQAGDKFSVRKMILTH